MTQLVRRELVVAPFSPQEAFPRSFRVYAETPTKYIVPFHWARASLPPCRDARPEPQHMEHAFVGSLKRDLRQHEAVAAVQHAWKNTTGAMLALPPGFGKTTCALYLACALGLKTLVIVHKEFLMHQWIDRIKQHVPTATISTVRGAECDTSGDFVVCMLQTLVSRKFPASTFATCGLVCVDEVHHIAATVFSQAMFALCAKYTLGLSATPDRRDRLGRVVTWFMGDVAFKLARTNQGSTRVKILKYTCPDYSKPPPLNRRGDVCYASIMGALVSNAHRTLAVAHEARQLALEGRHVLVLSHRRGHCEDIAARLRDMSVECATYLGGDKCVPETQVIVATYALTSEGFDCPRLSALVLATPSSDVEQSCGRVMRGSSDVEAIIVDVADQWGVCYSQYAKRRAFYKKSGFDLEDTNTPHATCDVPPLEGFAFIDE